MSKWVEISPTYYFTLPHRAACYVIYLDGQLAYIGQTSSLRKRFGNYQIRPGYGGDVHTPWGTVSTVKVKCKFADRHGEQAMWELRLIKRLKPPENCVGGGRKKPSKSKLENSPYSEKYYVDRSTVPGCSNA